MSGNSGYRPRIAARTRQLRLRGATYEIHEWGETSQPTIIMLHGWGDCGGSFQFTVDALQGDWHVIAPDWRGFGDTSHNDGSYWFPDYLADLDALLDTLDVTGPCRLVGHSMGGNVAALFAGAFPERVAAFVNVEGFGLPDSDPEHAPTRLRKWLEAVRTRREHPGYDSLAPLVNRIRRQGAHITEERARYVAALWSAQASDHRWYLKADIAHRWPNPVLYRRAEARACWRRITARVLLVCGDDTEYREAMAAWHTADAGGDYPGSHCLSIENAGHMVHIEQPEALAAAIEGFFST
ncbi:MAG: alpha/beta hydrolase [Woeseia sp.]|nr:alpha/beta hydrolase [Woeseia sp.]MBT8095837.1 alpha/beta hydrolase [Woeseia sp.]